MEISNKILSEITVYMKYAKYVPELNRRETWEELVMRNEEMHQKKYPQLRDEIEAAYKFVYDKKVLPSMRSLQFGGKPIEISPNRIYNCAYLPIDDYRAFGEAMFLLLGGTGVGYSVQTHHVEKLPEIRKPNPKRTRRYLIADSIEGWADAVKALVKSYFEGGSTFVFDFSDIRAKGARLVTSGGKAPGPQPLKECLIKLQGILDAKEEGDKLTAIEVHDMVCHVADAVLAGGIRRAALISLFSADDE
jgi:ribonucleoside-diphosphate reductase alpha chain